MSRCNMFLVFDDADEIVAVAGGVKFQCVPKALLDTLLSAKKAAPARPIPAPAVQVKQQKTSQTTTKARVSQPTNKAPNVELGVTKKAKTSTRIDTQMTGNLTSKALLIIANEVGCETSELADPIALSDLGIDSLMSLSISGRFREELELEFQSSVFNEMETIGQLKSFMRKFETISESPASSGYSTPDMINSDASDYSECESELPEPEDPVVQDLGETGADSDLVHIIRSTIAEEMGVELEEISDNTDLSTMGMDSLMSLSILGALREKTGLTMHSDLLVENTSIEMIETSLGLRTVKARATAKKESTVAARIFIPALKPAQTSSYPPATSVLLQGNPKTATHTLFVLPDGSGSATSYTTIPDIAASSLKVYGLNCPFMTRPEQFTIGVAGVTQIYMAEIQRRQPKGPYLLAGWSAGGVLAYEMTRQLIAKGERVEKLLLLDSPSPVGLEALPPMFHQYCKEIGLLGTDSTIKLPEWLLPHFASTVRELTAYSESLGDASQIDVTNMPPTVCIWARDGIVHKETDKKPDWDPSVRMPNSMHWLVNNRSNLGPCGWEKLVGNNVKCLSMPGNHFTMMRAPLVSSFPYISST
jgi:thioesterase domain-containing protein/acyl carrier protein